mmetsp:Transcript_67782/g.102232  ORF Transcript_67782/g.102232 Transcript_67782/m.102232 type:complete len:80 (-) Transcript_67782:247-486(-)
MVGTSYYFRTGDHLTSTHNLPWRFDFGREKLGRKKLGLSKKDKNLLLSFSELNRNTRQTTSNKKFVKESHSSKQVLICA